MDVDRKIQQLKKLIVTAEGETLDYLVEQLHTLLTKQRAERQAREPEDQPTQADTEPVAAGTQPPSLEIKEKHSALKIVGINNNVLKEMYIKSEGVRGFVMSTIQWFRYQSVNKTSVNSPAPMTSACSCIHLQDSSRPLQTHVGTSTRVQSCVHESHTAFTDLQGNPRLLWTLMCTRTRVLPFGSTLLHVHDSLVHEHS
jgi:hypothetical protein